ncbi:MAG: glutamate synthase [Elusimicrobia bacterium RIFOXYB2_FULL_49_7]|nr:MAG: glutamate synthase [Elusimicrobia bacterium RIFOXYB2_FULL_49_7]
MAKPTGFLEIERAYPHKRPVAERVTDFREIEELLNNGLIQNQAARCMDCGIPFCHAYGCPVHNRIPDMNTLLFKKQWRKALDLIHLTNNFPEITGRICPALCEEACTLAVGFKSVSIRMIELHLVERGFREGWVLPQPAEVKSNKSVAVIGSGPAGLACAQQLARMGHRVVVFEETKKPGGLLRYGIPDFKLEKWIIDRRLEQMEKEGVVFENEVCAGRDLSVKYIQKTFDAVVIATGSRVPRDIQIEGRTLKGIHFALDFLSLQNRLLSGESADREETLSAKGKKVVVIGGGDTGADCVGTCRRQGATDIIQLEVLPKPPATRDPANPWPTWPTILRSGSSHEEGCERLWSIQVKSFEGHQNKVERIHCAKLEWVEENGRKVPKEIPNTGFILDANLALLATGFIHPRNDELLKDMKIGLDERGNIRTDANQMTSSSGVFSAGDCVRGASLVVHAINQGRKTAEAVNAYLI